jgi:hypothetical protein
MDNGLDEQPIAEKKTMDEIAVASEIAISDNLTPRRTRSNWTKIRLWGLETVDRMLISPLF